MAGSAIAAVTVYMGTVKSREQDRRIEALNAQSQLMMESAKDVAMARAMTGPRFADASDDKVRQHFFMVALQRVSQPVPIRWRTGCLRGANEAQRNVNYSLQYA